MSVISLEVEKKQTINTIGTRSIKLLLSQAFVFSQTSLRAPDKKLLKKVFNKLLPQNLPFVLLALVESPARART